MKLYVLLKSESDPWNADYDCVQMVMAFKNFPDSEDLEFAGIKEEGIIKEILTFHESTCFKTDTHHYIEEVELCE